MISAIKLSQRQRLWLLIKGDMLKRVSHCVGGELIMTEPFKCEYPGCDKTFAISSSLTIHMVRPFFCRDSWSANVIRGLTMAKSRSSALTATRALSKLQTSRSISGLVNPASPPPSHADELDTGERPFACSFAGCGKRFPRPDQLKRHMAVHDADRTGKSKRGHSTHSSISTLA